MYFTGKLYQKKQIDLHSRFEKALKTAVGSSNEKFGRWHSTDGNGCSDTEIRKQHNCILAFSYDEN